MSVIDITEQESLEKIITENDTVIVNFGALSWCIPCQRFAPHYEMASEKSDAKFVHVDVDKTTFPEVKYSVQSVPTVMLFKDGQYVKHIKSRTAVKLLEEIDS